MSDRDELYELFHTDERTQTEFGYLWDTDLYSRCKKGAGYRKYKIQKLTYLPADMEEYEEKRGDRGHIIVTANLRGTHYKAKSKGIFVNFDLCYDEKAEKLYLRSRRRFWFTSVVDYFITMENTAIAAFKFLKKSKQYKHELHEIKMKHPEMFL